eukprot:TRINITY_DN12859_c0_g1_i1.p1 TRINITY_DN12859_c0_g1~~TRINITY_DN12859_c0_g1_i1.p1  ORF type:complete len:130 (+),score=17.73 TRINITY_DN12859_c0_g1_i1:83-472(+)
MQMPRNEAIQNIQCPPKKVKEKKKEPSGRSSVPGSFGKPAPKKGFSKPQEPSGIQKKESTAPSSLVGDAPMSLQEWLDDLGLSGVYFKLMNAGMITLKDLKGISKVRLESAGVENEKDISKIIRHSRTL